MNRKGSITLLLVAIIAILLGVIAYLLAVQNSPPSATKSPSIKAGDSKKNPASDSDSSSDSKVNGIVYTNEKYGFELELPSSWKGYVVKERKLDWGTVGQSDSIDFGFAEQDSLFNISIHSKSQWSKISAEDGPKPAYLNENDKYVFGFSPAQYAENEEMTERGEEAQAAISTFRIIEKDAAGAVENDATKDWAVITSAQDGYEIRYPENLDLGRGEPIQVVTNDSDLRKLTDRTGMIANKGKVTLGAIEYALTVGGDSAAGSTYEDYFYKTTKDGKTFTIYFPVRYANDCLTYANASDQASCQAFRANYKKQVEDIVATFKFIKKDAVSDWTVITNTIEGYQIKYPKNLDLGRGEPIQVVTKESDLKKLMDKTGVIANKGKVAIEGIQYALTVGGDSAAGSTYEDYFYKTTKDGKTFTIYFPVRYANDCLTYANASDQASCQAFKSGYKKQIEDVVATFKIIN